jgi:hypothetical protein
VEFSAAQGVTVKLACYPPDHSKYNPVERVFGVLENYWNGDPLCAVSLALGMAEGMTYKGPPGAEDETGSKQRQN